MEFRGGAGGEGVGSKVEDGVRSAAKEGGGSAANEVSGNIYRRLGSWMGVRKMCRINKVP